MKRSLKSAKDHSNGFVIESLITIAVLLVLPFVACSAFEKINKCSRLEGTKLDECLKRERLNEAPKAPK